MAIYQLQIHDIKSYNDFDNILQAMHDMDLLGDVFTCSWFEQENMAGVLDAQDDIEWCSKDHDMEYLSRMFPQRVFRIAAYDDSGYWHDYYHAGESQHCPVEIRYTKPLMIRWQER